MTQKIEVLSCGLGGPYEITIDGKTIADVESYELWQDEDGVHRVTFTVFTNNFQLKKDEKIKKLPKYRMGGFVNCSKGEVIIGELKRPTPNKTQECTN